MTDNNDDIDDIGIEDDFEEQKPQRASLKDAWESNPLLKIGAVVLVVAVLGFGYNIMGGFKEEEVNISRVGDGVGAEAQVVAGEEETDPEYQAAVEKQNKQRVEEALNTGTSAMPTPIATAKATSIEAPSAVQTKEDPLKEWRARTEAKRVLQEEQKPIEEAEAPAPDIVPMVQPVRPQPVIAVDPNIAAALSGQMRAVISQQIPAEAMGAKITAVDNEYAKMQKEKAQVAKDVAAGLVSVTQKPGAVMSAAVPAAPLADIAAQERPLIVAGSIIYAQLLNDLNSDLKGPALAQILSGPLQGGRAIGDYTVQNEEYLVLRFSRIVKDGVTYTVDAVALDEKTTLPGHEAEVDNHYLRRVILPAAAAFVSGYGSAVAETGTSTTVTGGGGVVSDTPEPDAKEELFKGLDGAVDKIGSFIDNEAQKPVTVKMKRGLTMGLLFTETLTTADVR